MSSEKNCCVPGCKESGGMHKVLHRFPDPENERERLRFNTWMYAIGGDILGMSSTHVYKNRRVCRSHFEDKYLCRNSRISNAAIPTLNLPGPLGWFKSPSGDRRPMQSLQQQNICEPSTSRDSGAPHLLGESFISQEIQKENIDPLTSVSQPGQKNLAQKPQDAHLDVSAKTPCIENVQGNQGPTVRAKKTTRRLYLNERERELHRNLVAVKIKLNKMKNKSKRQSAELKAARKLSRNPEVLNTLEHFSSTAKLLMQIQWRENRKKEKGRRFTLQEKIVALSILKQSPRAYKFFRRIFILPAPQTLVKLVQKANLHPGINKNIFSQLKKKCNSMSNEEKLCIILLDEISLKPQLTYEERKDSVTGFVDNGTQRTTELADHAQVFMVRGLIKNYKQPVNYTFSAGATKGPELAKQIKEVVTEVQQAGLTVVATVCDQGTNNRQALKILLNETRGIYLRRGEEPKQNVILINDQEIVPLYDPPHLLKGLRNNLITKNLIYEKEGKQQTAKWSHLQLLLKENPGYKGTRMIPKLTENHVNPDKINKMKVKYASQIFSRTIASNMGYLADKGILPKECTETADLLLFIDDIFDSVNGSYKKNKNAKPLLGPATPTSPHKKTWSEGKRLFKSMKYITAEGKIETVPTITNWVWTLEGIEVLLNNLKNNYNITSVWLRHLNQDPIENFFGSIRSHGCRNVNPTCDQFQSAFITLLINSMSMSVHARGKNCEDDYCDALHALVINESTEEPAFSCHTLDFDEIMNINFTPLEDKEKDPRKIAPLQYISGYFLKKTKTKIFQGCTQCKVDLCDDNEIEYIKYREYAGKRWLCTPSKQLINLISQMQDIANEILKKHLEKKYLNEIIKTTMLIFIDFNFLKCDEHKQKLIDYLIKIVNRCLIFNYCKYINKILAGRVLEIDDEEDMFQVKAKKYNRCFKRKR